MFVHIDNTCTDEEIQRWILQEQDGKHRRSLQDYAQLRAYHGNLSVKEQAELEVDTEIRRTKIEQEKTRLRKKRDGLFNKVLYALTHKRLVIKLEDRT